MLNSEIGVVAVVGAGTMGRRVAYACASHGRHTRIYDRSTRAAEEAASTVEALLNDHGPLDSSTGARCPSLELASTLERCVRHADLIIECVREDLGVKRSVFAEIDQYADRAALLATNSSSIPGSQLADVLRQPANLLNVNFGHLEHRKVEVMPHPGTATAALENMVTFLRDLELVPIVVRVEQIGYAINRVWRAVKKEVLAQIACGAVTPEDIDRGWMLDWGTAIGPCGLMDRIGLDVVRDIELVYFEASGDPGDRPPAFLGEMIRAGKTGVKAGAGFYRYPNPAYAQPGWLEGAAEVTRGWADARAVGGER